MNFIEYLKKRASLQRKRIILPEIMDERVIKAAEIILKEDFCDIVLIGNADEIEKAKEIADISKATIIDTDNEDLKKRLVSSLVSLRRDKGMTEEIAQKLLRDDYMYYACMLVKDGLADGVVSGACHSTANTLRPALQIIKSKKDVPFVSAFFLMEMENCQYNKDGLFIFADSGLMQNPTSEELAYIAGSSADSFLFLTEKEPRVALLSHSTLGSSKHSDVSKVTEAVKLAKKNFSQFKIDGELQVDAAIVPEVAKRKAPNSEVAGKANVLIFPDLDAGNIGYKLVERLANAKAYGPICQGLSKPINDLSRGCSVLDIVGVVAITAVQATMENS